MKRIMILIAILTLPMVSHAVFFSGNRLIEDMRHFDLANRNDPSTDYKRSTGYMSYVVGVYDTLHLSNVVCPKSNNVTIGQVTEIVAKFLKNNPERWDEPATDLVRDALVKAMPC